jgi:hypothetical protein
MVAQVLGEPSGPPALCRPSCTPLSALPAGVLLFHSRREVASVTVNQLAELWSAVRCRLVYAGFGYGLLKIVFPFPLKPLLMRLEICEPPLDAMRSLSSGSVGAVSIIVTGRCADDAIPCTASGGCTATGAFFAS